MMSTLPNAQQIQRLQLASPFAYQIWQNQTDSCLSFLQAYPLGQPLTSSMLDTLLTDCFVADEASVMAKLRQLRNRLMLRWIWQDALSLIDLENLTNELTVFADNCLLFSKQFVYQKLSQRYGIPCYHDKKHIKVDDLAIIAMGKMGANELNLSSDIDLIFIHQGQGETDVSQFGSKVIDNKKFMIRWGQGIIDLLDKQTEDGFVFRIDMRLRPWGDGSDLAIHLSALEKYFTEHGRAWERFAWIKARIVNDVVFADKIQALIKPFVFRYYVDYSAFSALREMKLLIQNQVEQRQDVDNIKLGAGGIRDIEFIVQAFQVIYGGRIVDIQVKNCLLAMRQLAKYDLLDKVTYMDLAQAYRFLRRLEHAIQARHDEQTQRLPKDDNERQCLAQTLGFDDWQRLWQQLHHYRQMVMVPFEKMVTERQVINKQQPIAPNQQDILAEVLQPENQQKLQNFWQSNLIKKLSDEAKKRLQLSYPVIVHALLHSALSHQQINVVLPRLLTLLESISRRSIYLLMLAENPNATVKLMQMLAISPWIASELACYPVLLDTFLREQYRHLPDKTELGDILRQQLLRVEPDDEESLLTAFRFFKKSQVLAVASSDILAERPLMKVSDSLTFIAEVVLEKALQRAFGSLVKKHGYPLTKTGEMVGEQDNGFAIIGYGKLGGLEMSYSSDLDLVFIHDIDEQAMTTGEKPVSGMKFASRLAQKLMNYLTTQTRDGRAYEIDMRLRPSGQAGMMVVSVQAYQLYQLEKAWSWEHQALVRARAICGDFKVMQQFDKIRQQVLCMPREQSAVRIDVAQMRHKMQEHLGSEGNNQGKFHLKQDAGGMIDIEFIAQYAVLAYAHVYPALAIWSDNVRIFETLAKTGVLAPEICEQLTRAYLTIRASTHQLALAEKNIIVDETTWHQVREFVDNQWQNLIGQRPNQL